MSVMIRRILYTLALLTGAVVLPAATAQPALAATEGGVALVQVNALLTGTNHDWNGSTFDFPSETCPQSNAGGNCWWWAANAWMALITWADENPGAPERDTIRTDLFKTYTTLCNGKCPTGPDMHGSDPFTLNTKLAQWFDDMGWWETTWLAAFNFTGNQDYLNLAEELWNYVTDNGYHWDQSQQGETAAPGVGCGGIPQYQAPNNTDPNGPPMIGSEDTFANALYLRDSAWLYALTQKTRYMQGVKTSWSNNTNVGGALAEASWIRQHLIFQYNSTALGTDGARFMMAGAVDASCHPTGTQTFLHAQGAMVSAWTDMSNACSTAGAGCSASPIYYDHLADELANSVRSDKLNSNCVKPLGVSFCWPFDSANQSISPPQKEPTVDTGGILSEMCIPTDPPGQSAWPTACPLGNSADTFQQYLIAKGIFERALYCVQSNITDSTLANFASTNATSLANTVVNYGFLWDSADTNAPVNFATRASILEGLDADLGQGHFGMC